MFRGHRGTSLLILALGGSTGAWARGAVIAVDGGVSPREHWCQSVEDVKIFQKHFPGATILSGDGPGSTEPNVIACDRDGQVVVGDDGTAKLVRGEPKGAYGPARLETFRKAIAQKVKQLRAQGSDGPLVLYFSDHGLKASDGKDFSTQLWGEDELTRAEMGRILREDIPKQIKVIQIHDHCYAAGMLDSIWDDQGKMRPGACGFAGSDRNEFAFVSQSLGGRLESTFQKGRPVNFGETFENDRGLRDRGSSFVRSSDLFLERELQGVSVAPKDVDVCVKEETLLQGLSRGLDGSQRALLKERMQGIRQDLAHWQRELDFQGQLTGARVEKRHSIWKKNLAQAEQAQTDALANFRWQILQRLQKDPKKGPLIGEMFRWVKERDRAEARGDRDSVQAYNLKLKRRNTELGISSYLKGLEEEETRRALRKELGEDLVGPAARAVDRVYEVQERLRLESNLRRSYRAWVALNRISQPGREKARRDYLSLLSCEHLPVVAEKGR